MNICCSIVTTDCYVIDREEREKRKNSSQVLGLLLLYSIHSVSGAVEVDNWHNVQGSFFVQVGTDSSHIFEPFLALCTCKYLSPHTLATRKEVKSRNTFYLWFTEPPTSTTPPLLASLCHHLDSRFCLTAVFYPRYLIKYILLHQAQARYRTLSTFFFFFDLMIFLITHLFVLPYTHTHTHTHTPCGVANDKRVFRSPSSMIANFTVIDY